MIRSMSILVAGLLCVAMTVNMGTSQDVKKPDDKGPEKKGKGQIPTGWGKLKLSLEQKKRIYAVQAEYKPKIKALEEQISTLRSQEHVDMVKVLTDAQRAELTKGLVPDEPKKDQPKTEDKKPAEKK